MHTITEDKFQAEGTRRIWNQITNDPEWVVALQKRKIFLAHHLNNTTLVDTFECIYL